MRRKDRDIIDDALWVAFERGREGSGLGAGNPRDVVKALEAAGFEIVWKAPAGRPHIVERTTIGGETSTRTIELVPGQKIETGASKASRWVLAQVVPGEVSVRPDDGHYAHGVNASATATVVLWGGRGPGEQREISVSTTSEADTDDVGEATCEAMTQAMYLAREAAEGFIEATEQALAAAA